MMARLRHRHADTREAHAVPPDYIADSPRPLRSTGQESFVPRLIGRAPVMVLVMVVCLTGAIAGLARLDRDGDPPHPPPQLSVPAAGETGASTCTDPQAGRQWRVTWKITAGPPIGTPITVVARARATTIVPTGFSARPTRPDAAPAPATSSAPSNRVTASGSTNGVPSAMAAPPAAGGWVSRDGDIWLLRWSPAPGETGRDGPDETYERAGPFATLSGYLVNVGQSPRYVTPDGACTVFLTPFVSGPATGNTVALVGDSLVAQLDAPLDPSTEPGVLQRALQAGGFRVEINGQTGRRFTALPGKAPGIESADTTLLDEIRGLRAAHSMVIALGTNDAGWIALSPDQETYELRLAWVLLRLAPMLDEIRQDGHCTVLVTMAERNKRYAGSAPGRFDEVAQRINAYLRQQADADPQDGLRAFDWAAVANSHGTTDPQPWFGADTIHLTTPGPARYADALAQAAALC
jgi:lysophospholipase L1-like esterase